jgi:hypothetical protein
MARSERGWGFRKRRCLAQEPVYFACAARMPRREAARSRQSRTTAVCRQRLREPATPICRRGTLLFRLILDVLDGVSHEWLAIRVARKLIDVLPDLFILRGVSDALGDGALHIGARIVVRTSSILN